MELWIRSQNKCKLRKTDIVNYNYEVGKHIVDCNGYPCGVYESKKRCLEIIDEIQNILCRSERMLFKDIDITNFSRKDIEPSEAIIWFSSPVVNEKSEVTIHNAEVVVYEMPKE